MEGVKGRKVGHHVIKDALYLSISGLFVFVLLMKVSLVNNLVIGVRRWSCRSLSWSHTHTCDRDLWLNRCELKYHWRSKGFGGKWPWHSFLCFRFSLPNSKSRLWKNFSPSPWGSQDPQVSFGLNTKPLRILAAGLWPHNKTKRQSLRGRMKPPVVL